MGVQANIKDFFDRATDLDLDDAAVLNGSNQLILPNNQHVFNITAAGATTIASIMTGKREGRVVTFMAVQAGINVITFTDTAFGSRAEVPRRTAGLRWAGVIPRRTDRTASGRGF